MKNLNLNDLHALQSKFGKSITLRIEIISPDVAKSYLQKNIINETVKNRTISKSSVNLYVKDILAGRWKVGTPIIFDEKDCLIDGQTRCTAVVKANKPILSTVLRGVPSDNFDVIDGGKK